MGILLLPHCSCQLNEVLDISFTDLFVVFRVEVNMEMRRLLLFFFPSGIFGRCV